MELWILRVLDFAWLPITGLGARPPRPEGAEAERTAQERIRAERHSRARRPAADRADCDGETMIFVNQGEPATLGWGWNGESPTRLVRACWI